MLKTAHFCVFCAKFIIFAPGIKTKEQMKKILLMIFCAMMLTPAVAQGLNDNGDNILGEYLTERGGTKSKVRVTKNADGTYKAQVFWVEKLYDESGNKRKDVKNPDKSLRDVYVDEIVLVKGLKYIAEDKEWGDAKIYDPTMGIKVNATAEFTDANTLKLRGTIMGIGKTLYWTKLSE